MAREWREGGKRPSAGLVLGKGISGVIVGDLEAIKGDRKLDCATLGGESVVRYPSHIYTPTRCRGADGHTLAFSSQCDTNRNY